MNHTLIIAEAGVNHNGSLDMALKLVDKAAEAGVDIVKFQTFRASRLVSRDARQAEYQRRNIGGGDGSQLSMLQQLELSPEDHLALIARCRERRIRFLSTPFDLESIDTLSGLGMGLWKIPSGEVTDYPFLVKIARTGDPVILSTGMCTMADVEAAVRVLLENGTPRKELVILHCNTEYPTPFSDVNLRAMCALQERFGVRVGYSDHTAGIEVPIAAVALGASVIEKHFTLDRTLPGPDHKASLEPHELKAMATAIRNVEKALGDGKKCVTLSEAKNLSAARKSIVAACPIYKGELFTEQNLTVKRPGTGISPMCWPDLLGKVASRDFLEDEMISL